MKRVFSNAMVAHVWAQGTQDDGRNSSSTFYFRGRTLYSYRDSWPLAYIDESGVVIINTENVSVTTREHRSLVYNALPIGVRKIFVDCVKVVQTVSQYCDNPLLHHREAAYMDIANWVERSVQDYLYKAAKRRCMYRRTDDLEDARSCINTGQELANLIQHGVEYNHHFAVLTAPFSSDVETLLASCADRIKEEREAEKGRKEKRKLEEAEYRTECIEKFRNGDTFFGSISGNQLLRLKDKDTVQTSGSATFPVQDAVHAFPLILRVRDGGFDYVPTAGVTKQRLGEFRIDKVYANGNVTAGCHYVEWVEIERLAKELGLITKGE